MNNKAKIEVGVQIGGYTIDIDRNSINLSQEEAIVLTALLLKKGAGLNLADIVDPSTKNHINSIIEAAA